MLLDPETNRQFPPPSVMIDQYWKKRGYPPCYIDPTIFALTNNVRIDITTDQAVNGYKAYYPGTLVATDTPTSGTNTFQLYRLFNLYRIAGFPQHYCHALSNALRITEFFQAVDQVVSNHPKWERVSWVHWLDRSKFVIKSKANGDLYIENMLYYLEPIFRRRDDPNRVIMFQDGTDAFMDQTKYAPNENILVYRNGKIIYRISLQEAKDNPQWKETLLKDLSSRSRVRRASIPAPDPPGTDRELAPQCLGHPLLPDGLFPAYPGSGPLH